MLCPLGRVMVMVPLPLSWMAPPAPPLVPLRLPPTFVMPLPLPVTLSPGLVTETTVEEPPVTELPAPVPGD